MQPCGASPRPLAVLILGAAVLLHALHVKFNLVGRCSQPGCKTAPERVRAARVRAAGARLWWAGACCAPPRPHWWLASRPTAGLL